MQVLTKKGLAEAGVEPGDVIHCNINGLSKSLDYSGAKNGAVALTDYRLDLLVQNWGAFPDSLKEEIFNQLFNFQLLRYSTTEQEIPQDVSNSNKNSE